MSLFDHLLFGANVDASGSSTQADGRVYADTFSIVDGILQYFLSQPGRCGARVECGEARVLVKEGLVHRGQSQKAEPPYGDIYVLQYRVVIADPSSLEKLVRGEPSVDGVAPTR